MNAIARRRNSGVWIPWLFAAGLAIVVGANVALAYFAAHSAPGMVTAKPYDSGAAYNSVLDRAAAQDRLGWRARARFEAAAPGNGRITLELRDRDGHAIPGLAVAARLVRPVEPLPHLAVDFRNTTDGGYEAEIAVPRTGAWDLYVLARRGGDEFEFSQRLLVP
jgi:nitrogen fixation protein FixH